MSLTILAGIVAAAVGMLLYQEITATSFADVSVQVNAYRGPASVIRLLGIGLLCATWPSLIKRKFAERDPRLQQWQALRWRVVLWLLLMELTLGQNLLGRILA